MRNIHDYMLEEVPVTLPAVFLPLGVLAGAVATLGVDAVMRLLPEGATPPRVAASVLTATEVDEAPERLATFAHYFAGAGTGVLYVWVLLAVETVVGVGVSPVATVAVSAAFLYVSMVAFFASVPLPVSDGLSRERRRRTARDWAVCAAVYVVIVVPAVFVLSAAVSAV